MDPRNCSSHELHNNDMPKQSVEKLYSLHRRQLINGEGEVGAKSSFLHPIKCNEMLVYNWLQMKDCNTIQMVNHPPGLKVITHV
jgi:hypothetical protein